MVKRSIRNALAPVLIGAVSILAPEVAGASAPPTAPEASTEAGERPVSAARRKPRVPTTAPVVPEDVDDRPPVRGAPPDVSIPPPDVSIPRPEVPVAPPPPPPTTMTTEAPPVVESKVTPPPTHPAVHPVGAPEARLPTTGVAAAAAAVAGAFLSLGGLCIAAGRGTRRQVAASAQRTP